MFAEIVKLIEIIVGRTEIRGNFEDTISAWILLNGSNLINAMRDDSRDYIRSYLFIYSNRGKGGETLEKADLISSDIRDTSRIVEKDRVSSFR